MLDRRRRRWANIKTSLGQRINFAGDSVMTITLPVCVDRPQYKAGGAWCHVSTGSAASPQPQLARLLLPCNHSSTSADLY